MDAPVAAPAALAPLRTERLVFGTLLAYSAAQFGLSASNTLLATQLPFFYVDTLALPPTLFGLVMLIAKLWNAVFDPVMGHVTDNTRHRWGRRRPYLLLGAPPLALATFLLFTPPARTGASLFSWLLLTYVCALTTRSVVETPYQAMAPDLTTNYDERTRVATWRTSIGMLGDLTGAMIPMLMLAFVAPRITFHTTGFAVGALILTGAAIAFLGVHERFDATGLERKPLLANLAAIAKFPVRNRPARLLIISSACAVFATTTPVSVFRFLDRYVFTATGLERSFLGPAIARIGPAAFLDIGVILGYFAGVFLSAPLWARALRTRDKKHGYVFAFLYLGAVVCGVFAIPRNLGILFPLLNMLVGAGALGLWMLPGAIGPDVLEWEELHHGDRHEGGFYGIWMLVQKTGAAVALFALGFLLQAIGFVAGHDQAPGTLLGLRFLYGGTPLLVCLVSALVFSRYPLTREVYEDVRRRIEARTPDGLH
jgi:glycoside/pentoside/hexuronide:cation symporter, GPH family